MNQVEVEVLAEYFSAMIPYALIFGLGILWTIAAALTCFYAPRRVSEEARLGVSFGKGVMWVGAFVLLLASVGHFGIWATNDPPFAPNGGFATIFFFAPVVFTVPLGFGAHGLDVWLDEIGPKWAVARGCRYGSVAKIVKLEHAWRRLDGRNDDGFQVAPFPG